MYTHAQTQKRTQNDQLRREAEEAGLYFLMRFRSFNPIVPDVSILCDEDTWERLVPHLEAKALKHEDPLSIPEVRTIWEEVATTYPKMQHSVTQWSPADTDAPYHNLFFPFHV